MLYYGQLPYLATMVAAKTHIQFYTIERLCSYDSMLSVIQVLLRCIEVVSKQKTCLLNQDWFTSSIQQTYRRCLKTQPE